jgi:hypothetical protein
VSDAFSFLFSFYGLLLGLAFAELASGFSRAWDDRKHRRIGVLAPLFAAVLLLDLITFWVNAWVYRELTEVTFELALTAAAVALLYYFASTLVFPKQGDFDSLDVHILQHRRTVVGCVVASNLLHVVPEGFAMAAEGVPAPDLALWCCMNGFYYLLLGTAALVRSRWIIVSALATTIALITGATILFS